MRAQDYYPLIRQWAQNRKIITESTPKAQFVKLVEEWKEIAEDPKDGVGDSLVVLVIIAAQFGIKIEAYVPAVSDKTDVVLLGELATDLNKSRDPVLAIRRLYARLHEIPVDHGLSLCECVEQAYNEIKDRKGEMVAGTWVKEEDL